MNIDYLKTRFAFYNIILFNSELPLNPIIWIRDLSPLEFLGCFDEYDNSITIHCELEPYEVDPILIHEMIHLWEIVKFGKTSHRQRFRDKAKQIRKITKFKIPIYADEIKLDGL